MQQLKLIEKPKEKTGKYFIWTNEEIELLKNHYATIQNKELVKFLPHRTLKGIKDKANKLGLRKAYRIKPAFSNEELLLLLRGFAKKLGRTPNTSEIDNDKSMPSYSTYYLRFGCYKKIIRLAGLKPNIKLKTKHMEAIEKKFQSDIRIILKELYENKQYSVKKIGKIIGINHNAVWEWLKRFNIKRRLKYKKTEFPNDFKRKCFELGYALGLANSDGYLSKYMYELQIANRQWANNIYTVLKRWTGRPPYFREYYRTGKGIHQTIRYTSIDLVNFLKKIHNYDFISSDIDMVSGYLSAFIDADGSIDKNKGKTCRLRIFEKEYRLNIVKKLFEDWNVTSSQVNKVSNRNVYEVCVYNSSNFSILFDNLRLLNTPKADKLEQFSKNN